MDCHCCVEHGEGLPPKQGAYVSPREAEIVVIVVQPSHKPTMAGRVAAAGGLRGAPSSPFSLQSRRPQLVADVVGGY